MLKVYKCTHCGNMVTFLNDQRAPLSCCGEEMKLIKPNSVDAANEKHVPVVEVSNNLVKVTVGSVEHPMTEAHYITMIMIETNKGFQVKHLTPTDKPYAEFLLAEGESLVATYEYCNLHGLWMKEN